jgi:hypothetical protein
MLAGGNAGDLRQLWIPAGAAGELKGRALHFSKFPKFLKMLENPLKNEKHKKNSKIQLKLKKHTRNRLNSRERRERPGSARGLNED